MAQTVLGIDPGTHRAGWALLGRASDAQPVLVDSGAWVLGNSRQQVADRLSCLRRELHELLQRSRPELLALEAAFFGKNARSALRLGEARGVILVTAREHGLEVLELPPAQVKRRVAGSGAANKEQIARLVAAQLGCETSFSSPDESDAVAVGLCGLIETAGGDAPVRRAGQARSWPRGAQAQ